METSVGGPSCAVSEMSASSIASTKANRNERAMINALSNWQSKAGATLLKACQRRRYESDKTSRLCPRHAAQNGMCIFTHSAAADELPFLHPTDTGKYRRFTCANCS